MTIPSRPMSSSTKSTIKFALVAYSVYCWVDGTARTRNNPSSDFTTDPPYEFEPAPEHESRGWRAVWEWMCSPGSSMSEQEQSAVGRMDAITAFLLFNGTRKVSFHPASIHTPSLFPFSLSHLKDADRLRWKLLILFTALLSLIHETQRAALIYYLRRRRTNLTNQILKDLADMRIGQIAVQGDNITLQPQEGEEEEEEECLICSGSAETMSTSSHADSSMTTRTGPLEAFCTIAPQKHLAHRQCFLRWHSAYLQQQSRHSLGTLVALLDDSDTNTPTPLEQLYIRARTILQASGFEYLAPRLTRPEGSGPAQPGDTLTIHTDIIQSTPRTLATLRTSTPPCPGCRSPVCLRFVDTQPRSPSHISHDSRPRPTSFIQRMVFAGFWRVWRRTVTGRTILAHFSSLLSFMAALATITRVHKNPAWRISL
ncbi:hypothetical protein OPQ81_002388 [Rhizoctonia solani]|nr:hypothetical protein OPQ81_002388 [Rhizoctonia solani]